MDTRRPRSSLPLWLHSSHARIPRMMAVGLAMWLTLGLAHATLLFTVAGILQWATRLGPIQAIVTVLPTDDVHSLLALRVLGDAQPSHLTVLPAGTSGIAGHLAGGSWLHAVFAAGTPDVAVHLATIFANVTMLAVGLLIVTIARTTVPPGARARTLFVRGLYSFGVLTAFYAAAAQLSLGWTGGGGYTVLSLIATKLAGLNGEMFDGAMANAGMVLGLTLNLATVAVVMGAGYGAERLASAVAARRALRNGTVPAPRQPTRARPVHAVGLLAGLLLFQTPLNDAPAFELPPALPVTTVEAPATPPESVPTSVPVAAGPSVVTLTNDGGRYVYRVNGRRRSVRGVGYNATVADSTEDERRQRYERDFAMIRAAGANTLLGWDQKQFDAVLLEEAHRQGLGVILPFELDPAWKYNDPHVRAGLLVLVGAWVERHRDSPALRMWGLGNEVVHGIKKADSPAATAFASFLVEAADLVHRLDPNHPVIYRDAEDVYLDPVARELARSATARPWFVYGMNFFTYRLGPALRDGPARQLGQPVLISEFGPVGLRPADRPEGYVKQWRMLREYSGWVVGGCAYVWTTAGPEPLDRSFGLTAENGNPVDGSLAALASVYLTEAADSVEADALLAPDRAFPQ